MIKILAIGNSFAVDACSYLHDISVGGDVEILSGIANLGGCSLERHMQNIRNNEACYVYHRNGKVESWTATLGEILHAEEWDIITVQQVSQCSGDISTFFPFIEELIAYVKKARPNAKIYFHKTWSYPSYSKAGGFAVYHNSQKEMGEAIERTFELVSERVHFDGLFDSKATVDALRKEAGEKWNRDDIHLNEKARYLVALSWIGQLTGQKSLRSYYIPMEGYFDCKANDSLITKEEISRFISICL